jgi:hypothetical protein
MVILICSILVVIFSTTIFIAKTYHWLAQQPRFGQVHIVERAWRAVDLQTQFSYTEMCMLDRYPVRLVFPDNVVRDIEHKQYLIRMQARRLTDEMLASGLIRIEDVDDHRNPYLKHTILRVKVYQPESSAS